MLPDFILILSCNTMLANLWMLEKGRKESESYLSSPGQFVSTFRPFKGSRRHFLFHALIFFIELSWMLAFKGQDFFFLFSIPSKNEQLFYSIYALASQSRKGQIKKNFTVLLFFWFNNFLEAREEIEKFFRLFFWSNWRQEKILMKLPDL